MDRSWIQRISGICASHISKDVEQCVVVRGKGRGSIGRRGRRVPSVIRIESIHRINDLGEIVFRLSAPGLVLDCLERGEEQANKDRNDPNNDEELNEGERAVALCYSGVHCADYDLLKQFAQSFS